MLLTFGLRVYLCAKTVLNSNRKIHDDIVNNLVRSPQKYFDVTAEGELMNKISNDLSILDNAIIVFVDDILERAMVLPFSMATVVLIDKPFLLAVGVGLICNILTVWYIKGALIFAKQRMLQEKAKIFSHFTDTFSALTLIHNFKR